MSSKSTKLSNKRSTVNRVSILELRGGKFNPPPTPPQTSSQRWFPVTLIIRMSGQTTYTYGDVVKALRKQVDPAKTLFKRGRKESIILSRIKSIRVWNLDGTMVGLTVFDFIKAKSSASNTICGLMDTANKNHVPSIGYKLPQAHCNFTLTNGNGFNSNTNDSIFCTFCGPRDNAVVYVQMSWSCDGPIFRMGHSETVEDILVSIRSHVNRMICSPDIDNCEIGFGSNMYEDCLSPCMPFPLVQNVSDIQLTTRAVETTSDHEVSSVPTVFGHTGIPVEYHGSKTTGPLRPTVD